MPMNPEAMEGTRETARLFSIIFYFLALLTFGGTLWGTAEVAKLGTQIGIGGAQDPVTWFVLVGGTVAAIVFAGFGCTLGILCSIFDRQGLPPPAARSNRDASVRQRIVDAPAGGRTSVWYEVADREVRVESPASVEAPMTVPKAAQPKELEIAHTTTGPAQSPKIERRALWAWLTKERHIFK